MDAHQCFRLCAQAAEYVTRTNTEICCILFFIVSRIKFYHNGHGKLLSRPVKAAVVAVSSTDLKEIENEIKALVHESLDELASGI
jgi:hypothetical protein